MSKRMMGADVKKKQVMRFTLVLAKQRETSLSTLHGDGGDEWRCHRKP